jgi:glyoxylase-like metal-dependent hydrolase (beta-lactamase superfamily II)
MTIRTFHLNCGTLRPYGLFPLSTIPLSGRGRYFGKGLGILHCLLVDTGEGLILVDSGYGTQDYSHPSRFVKIFNRAIGLVGDVRETALHQINSLGYDAEDVKHIFLTHMHLDHTGGLPDFPHAKVHVFEKEYDMAMNASGFISNFYINRHWEHNPDWEIHSCRGDNWFRLECTPEVEINNIKEFFVPMPGHSPGNCMVVLHLPDDNFIVHSGDTFYSIEQIASEGPIRHPFHWAVQLFNIFNPVTMALYTHEQALRRLRCELGDKMIIFSSHDPNEYERLSGINLV